MLQTPSTFAAPIRLSVLLWLYVQSLTTNLSLPAIHASNPSTTITAASQITVQQRHLSSTSLGEWRQKNPTVRNNKPLFSIEVSCYYCYVSIGWSCLAPNDIRKKNHIKRASRFCPSLTPPPSSNNLFLFIHKVPNHLNFAFVGCNV